MFFFSMYFLRSNSNAMGKTIGCNMDHFCSVAGSSQADRGVNCSVHWINEVQLSIFKDHKELGVPSMDIVTPPYGLDHLISHTQSEKDVCIKCPHQLWDSLPRVKWLGCEANYTLPYSAKVKDMWSYTPTPHPPYAIMLWIGILFYHVTWHRCC